MAKNAKRRVKRAPWTKAHDTELRKHSKGKVPAAKISKLMKRTIAAVRQRASVLGISLRYRR